MLIDSVTTPLGVVFKNVVLKVQHIVVTQAPIGSLTTENKFNMGITFDVFEYDSVNKTLGTTVNIGVTTTEVPYDITTPDNAIKFAYTELLKLPVFKSGIEI